MEALYQIAEDHNKTLLEMAEIEDLNEDVVNDMIELMEGDFKSKAISVAGFFQNIDGDIAAMKEAEKRIAVRRKSAESKVIRMKEYLLSNMLRTGITKIECPEFSISTRKNPAKLVISDDTKIPMIYKETITKTSVVNAKLKDALKSGIEIEGAELTFGASLTIK